MEFVKYIVTDPPTKEPVLLADVKVHLRTIPGDTSEDAAILTPLISAAREYCENFTGRAFAAQTIAAYPNAGQRIVALPKPPIIRVDSVKTYMADGTEETLAPSAYVFDDVSGVMLLNRLPSNLRMVNPVKITYRAGYESIPLAVRQAMLLLIGHWYENREAVVVGAIASIEVKSTASALLNQHKVWWF